MHDEIAMNHMQGLTFPQKLYRMLRLLDHTPHDCIALICRSRP